MERKPNPRRKFAAIVAAILLAASLAGCSGGAIEDSTSHGSAAEEAGSSTIPVTTADPEPTEVPEDTGETVEPELDRAMARIDRLKEKQAAEKSKPAESSAGTPADTPTDVRDRSSERLQRLLDAQAAKDAASDADMSGVENVARLGSLVGNMSLPPECQDETVKNTTPSVDIDNAHNPYDLTWEYGDGSRTYTYDQTVKHGWGSLYQSYVDACDWSLVFDAEYYKSAFPVLAELYHYDDELLLEHFQTVGVHEGRQGGQGFNVAAYMDHCDKALRDAFGNDYECYYFYWMLNQDTQKSVVTTGDYKTWQSVELSWFQQDELEHVNAYRAEVGADPVEVDPEMVAFACVRAWYDAVGNVRAHDNLYHDSVDEAMDGLDVLEFYENTTKRHSAGEYKVCDKPWKGFRNSTKGHYEAMVLDTQRYFGCSNSYFSSQSGTKCLTEFDMFTPETPKTSR